MLYLKSRLLDSVPGVVHGFGTKAEPVPAPFRAQWDTHRPKWQQVHGAASAHVTQPRQECGEVDAVWTDKKGLMVAVQHADCVPVLLARKDGSAVAAIHAGWRGTYQRIVEKTWATLVERTGARASDWVAAVGPAARACCYEVGLDLVADFKAEFKELDPFSFIKGERMLDNHALNLHQLRGLGLETDLLAVCTICGRDANGEPQFFSHRRKPKEGRQWSVIERR